MQVILLNRRVLHKKALSCLCVAQLSVCGTSQWNSRKSAFTETPGWKDVLSISAAHLAVLQTIFLFDGWNYL